MNRTLATARLHLVNPALSLGIPWFVAGSSFVINLLVWGLTAAGEQPGGGSTGGLAALYITVLIVFAQSITQLLPFAMGLSVTRRTFYLGTAVFAVVQSLLYGVVLTVLDAIENATGGWGLRLHFWAPGRMDVANPVLQFLVFAGPMLACCFLGLAFGVVLKRWGQVGLWTTFVGLAFLLGGALALIGYQGAWTSVFDWFRDTPMLVLAFAVPLAVAAVTGVLGWAGARRVVP
ncbi:hypothetical protein [Modestobacter sp. NPDC049651]|uniref:hypothetical protein n=1 Tax=unclassified Modestobacter TaxID=2643866 RepID=UPI0033DD9BE8